MKHSIPLLKIYWDETKQIEPHEALGNLAPVEFAEARGIS